MVTPRRTLRKLHFVEILRVEWHEDRIKKVLAKTELEKQDCVEIRRLAERENRSSGGASRDGNLPDPLAALLGDMTRNDAMRASGKPTKNRI